MSKKNIFNKKDSNNKYKKNEEIFEKELRLVGDNVKSGVYSKYDALEMAKELELDLILINPNQNPPICKIADYGKLIYNEKKKQKEREKNNRQNRVELKELRFGPNTGTGDLKHKAKKAIEFLKDGNNVKLTVQFRGRQMAHKELGERLLLEFATSVNEFGIAESLPKLEGRRMSMVIRSKK